MALALLSAIGFSWKAILAKLAYRTGVGPMTVVGLRMAFSLPAYAGLAWIGRQQSPSPLSRRDYVEVAVLALGGFYIATFLDFLGLTYISAGLERLILFLHPAIVVAIAARLHGRRITRREALAMLLGYGGIAFVFLGDAGGGRSSGAWIGALAVLAGSVAYAAYLAFSESVVARLGATRFTGLSMTIASVAGVVQFAATRAVSPETIPMKAVWLCAAIAAFATVVPTWLLNQAIRRIGSGRAALLGMSGPIATMVLETVVLGEPASAADVAGTACALVGIVLLTTERPRAVRSATPESLSEPS
jgi:drug/metabolite transporter (DMT)-like permease